MGTSKGSDLGVAQICDATACRRVKPQLARVINLKGIRVCLRSVQKDICGVLPAVDHEIREAAALKDRSMSFRRSIQTQLKPVKARFIERRLSNAYRRNGNMIARISPAVPPFQEIPLLFPSLTSHKPLVFNNTLLPYRTTLSPIPNPNPM